MLGFFKTFFESIAGPLFFFAGLIAIYFVFRILNVDIESSLAIIIALSPIWLPAVLFYLTFERWMYFVRSKFAYEQGRTTLRIKLPQEVLKSPEAMESVLSQIHAPNGPENIMQTYWDGKHPLITSLEIVSIGGEIRFYANVPKKKAKNAIEAQLYAQYPGVEVVEELIDYTAEIKWNPEKYDLMSFHIVKKNDSIYPIKTYIDFGHDKMPKEEEKFEPMAPLIEHLGKAKPHERLWVQILLQPHAKKSIDTGDLQAKGTWEADGLKKVSELIGKNQSGVVDEVGNTTLPPRVTQGERDTADAIERNVSKYAYEVAIRAMYITETDKFDGEMIGPMLKSFSQYDIIGRNTMGVRWRTDFDYSMFSDFSGSRKKAMKKSELEAYKARSYIPGDLKSYADAPKVMSVEEIATIYHLPGKAIITPSLTRIDSLRREAPANLPVGIPTHVQA